MSNQPSVFQAPGASLLWQARMGLPCEVGKEWTAGPLPGREFPKAENTENVVCVQLHRPEDKVEEAESMRYHRKFNMV
jgi:hypothetical protein